MFAGASVLLCLVCCLASCHCDWWIRPLFGGEITQYTYHDVLHCYVFCRTDLCLTILWSDAPMYLNLSLNGFKGSSSSHNLLILIEVYLDQLCSSCSNFPCFFINTSSTGKVTSNLSKESNKVFSFIVK